MLFFDGPVIIGATLCFEKTALKSAVDGKNICPIVSLWKRLR